MLSSSNSRERTYLPAHFDQIELPGLTWLERYNCRKTYVTLGNPWHHHLKLLQLPLCLCYYFEPVSYAFMCDGRAGTRHKIFARHSGLLRLLSLGFLEIQQPGLELLEALVGYLALASHISFSQLFSLALFEERLW